jgi:hypothetical protein
MADELVFVPDWLSIAGCVGVLIVLAMLIWGLKNPVVWRLLSVLAVAGGVWILVWGITAAAMRDPSIASPTMLIGGGAGMMAGGVMLLVVSFFSGPPRS